MFFQLKRGCFLSLKGATLFIGILGIASMVFLIWTVVANYQPEQIEALKVIDTLSPKPVEGGHADVFGRIMNIVIALVQIAVSTTLVVGAVQGRPQLVYAWIVLTVVHTMYIAIMLFTTAMYVTVIGNYEAGIILTLVLIIFTLLQIYMMLVVNSFRNTILGPPIYDYAIKKEPMLLA